MRVVGTSSANANFRASLFAYFDQMRWDASVCRFLNRCSEKNRYSFVFEKCGDVFFWRFDRADQYLLHLLSPSEELHILSSPQHVFFEKIKCEILAKFESVYLFLLF